MCVSGIVENVQTLANNDLNNNSLSQSFKSGIKPVQLSPTVKRLTPPASPNDHQVDTAKEAQDFSSYSRRDPRTKPIEKIKRKLNDPCHEISTPVQKDPRVNATELQVNNISSTSEKIALCTPNVYNHSGMSLREQILAHGVPIQALAEADGFSKMHLTFMGRISAVKKESVQVCRQLADTMITYCQKVFGDYQKFANSYSQARKDHKIKSEGSSYFPEDKVIDSDMRTVPPLLEFRRRLFQRFTTVSKYETSTIRFSSSELVDLCMYYFNHVASCKPWRNNTIA